MAAIGGKRATSAGSKPVGLPSWKKLELDWDHIAGGHMPGGSRVGPRKDVFENMTEGQVRSAIRNAYNSGKRMETQISVDGSTRVRVRGHGGGYEIEMWVNISDRVVETAYPIR